MAIKTGNRLDYDLTWMKIIPVFLILSKTVGPDGVGLNSGNSDCGFESHSVVQLEHLMAETAFT